MSPKVRTVWRCQQCGASAPKWLGRCPECGEFGTYVEEMERSERNGPSVSRLSASRPVPLSEATAEDALRIPTGTPEFDRVLGGGLVPGSLVLLGGEPGIGKSTLLLQVSDGVARNGTSVLYVCGEESTSQVGMRARRLGIKGDGLELMPEVDVEAVEHAVRERRPGLLVIDSIQTAYDPALDAAPGSVSQVRACAARFMRIAKETGLPTVVVGHVTKDGTIAGPRVLEHMVDSVLYFEGDRDHAFRIVRAVKNRFGSVSEIGVFEMGEGGLAGVSDPSGVFLGQRQEALTGSVVMPAMEGSRPLLVELQALVTPSFTPVPRRVTTGVESARLLQVLAVLERRAGLSFGSLDVYVSIAGGVRVAEPAVDLPLALALASTLRDKAIGLEVAAFGEVGLTGRIRPVSHTASRIREASRQGLTRVLSSLPPGTPVVEGASHTAVASVEEALERLGLAVASGKDR